GGDNEDRCFKLIGYPDWWPGKGRQEKQRPRTVRVKGESWPTLVITEARYQQLIKVLSARGQRWDREAGTNTYCQHVRPNYMPTKESSLRRLVHTPQQNGVVERKHRHLLETAWALRFEANLPTRFWGECVLIDAYIINRMPSDVIGNKTPYEKKKKFLYLQASGSMKLSKKKKKDLNGEPNETKIGHGEPIKEFEDDFEHHAQTEAHNEDQIEVDVGPEGSQDEDNQFGPTKEPTFNSDSNKFVEPTKRNRTRPTYLDDYDV
nr:putative ribonuclease H-like domain-containing protein [Tanacetum cinerariifolium]